MRAGGLRRVSRPRLPAGKTEDSSREAGRLRGAVPGAAGAAGLIRAATVGLYCDVETDRLAQPSPAVASTASRIASETWLPASMSRPLQFSISEG